MHPSLSHLESIDPSFLEPHVSLVVMREETELAGAGIEKWRVLQSGEQYVAVNEAFPNVRVPLEMMGAGQPKLIEWDRQKAPFANFGILRFAAGTPAIPGAAPCSGSGYWWRA